MLALPESNACCSLSARSSTFPALKNSESRLVSAKQLHATLCSKSVAPRYVLQLAVLLGLSLHDLLHAPDAVPDYKAEMKAMYQSGASMYHIAQLYGIDAKTLARWIKS